MFGPSRVLFHPWLKLNSSGPSIGCRCIVWLHASKRRRESIDGRRWTHFDWPFARLDCLPLITPMQNGSPSINVPTVRKL
ncbi:hypothetical protein OPV22_001888 [Ensete ventricosum]|uniref:Uncharacterized protein n=1 Tax=Ensete ventricosum TaxID=4639 RepID=A0AAV8RVZ4_ENSVE|nr:hypothetical protein OPV22_001888 [Ensete ventricosum]